MRTVIGSFLEERSWSKRNNNAVPCLKKLLRAKYDNPYEATFMFVCASLYRGLIGDYFDRCSTRKAFPIMYLTESAGVTREALSPDIIWPTSRKTF